MPAFECFDLMLTIESLKDPLKRFVIQITNEPVAIKRKFESRFIIKTKFNQFFC